MTQLKTTAMTNIRRVSFRDEMVRYHKPWLEFIDTPQVSTQDLQSVNIYIKLEAHLAPAWFVTFVQDFKHQEHQSRSDNMFWTSYFNRAEESPGSAGRVHL